MALTAAALVAVSAAAAVAAPALPIPSNSGPGHAKPFLGHARPAQPVDFGPEAPRHPYMAANSRSNIHDDAYQSDAYPGAGPLGYAPSVTSTLLFSDCASVTFDRRGRLVTVCVGVARPVLRLMDPRTLATIASYDLPPRPPQTIPTIFTSFGGGGYFYLDNLDRAVVPTYDGHILVIAVQGDAFHLVRDYDLSALVGDSAIISALPDWSGRLWFATLAGRVGFVQPATGVVRSKLLGEEIGNSFAVDETGGVFIVTDHALYRFDVVSGIPTVTWRKAYNRGTRVKPGQTEFGSGTTPTIVRRDGHHYIAITDNADPYMHVLLYRADRGDTTAAPFCSVPVFPANRGSTDNSLIAVGNGIVVENNYGYTGPSGQPPDGPFRVTPTTEPGLARVEVNYAAGSCQPAWTNDQVRIPTSVSKGAAKSGVVYVYEHPSAAEVQYVGRRPSDRNAADPWYLSAFDLRTGKRVWAQLLGYGFGYNNNYAPITIGPDGTAYVGVLGGLAAVRDTGKP
jgi:hypothetical protein